MRIQSPEIGWHGEKDRILSIDFHPFSNQVATAGSDEKKFTEQEREGTEGCIKIWSIIDEGKALNINILYGLSEASSNTNVVRFSPNGAYMASGADDKSVVIWEKRDNTRSIQNSQRIYRWSKKMSLMGHASDVLDLTWTRNSKFVVSTGMDARIFLWSIEKRIYLKVLDLHEKFVQGVAVDPTFQHIVSCGNDRTTRVWKSVKSKKHEFGFFCKRVLKRFSLDKKEEEDQEVEEKSGFRIFADERVPTFFRRPDFSPDGELFLLPAGQWQKSQDSNPEYCAFLYRKNYVDRPTMMLPTNGEPALVCQFCPVLFSKPSNEQGLFQQPYYMIFAIATSSSVILYNTLKAEPIYAMGNYHYATITDLTWRGDRILGISSSDGYCSFMIFGEGELGQEYKAEGELGDLMRVEPCMEKKEQTSTQPIRQQTVEMREVEGGGVKKRIIPKFLNSL